MMDDKDWAVFKQKLKAKTEIDLDLYKEPQMKRRIGNLVTRAGMDSFCGYFDDAAKDKDSFAAFIEYLTINVSEFFRTPEKFGKLETDVIPDLLKRSPKLNIWSAGCSIGAEPYSLAIIMKEMTPNTRHRILASDLDIEILAKAKRGEYNEGEIKSMSKDRLAKYFNKIDGDKYAVKNEIKSCIEFKRHNLLKDKFESFMWKVVVVTDGNDMQQVLDGMAKAKTLAGQGSPVCVILTTKMGYGVDFMQDTNKYHGSVLSADDLPKALAQLPETLGDF